MSMIELDKTQNQRIEMKNNETQRVSFGIWPNTNNETQIGLNVLQGKPNNLNSS